MKNHQLHAMHQLWTGFIGYMAVQVNLESTHRLGFEGSKVYPEHSIELGIHIAEGQTLGGTMLVTAESLAEATELSKKCPILFLGGMVEVSDVIAMN